MKAFKHYNAKTVKEAVKILQNNTGRAKVISGGTDLLGVLKDKILFEYPDIIINIKTIPGLDYIKEDIRGLKIGTLARLDDIAKSPVIRARYNILAEAAASVATPQVRRMGTIGGNLCQDVRCWYYRYPHQIGGRMPCYLKGGELCYALTGDHRYHSIFGGIRVGTGLNTGKVNRNMSQSCISVNPSDIGVVLMALDAKIKIAGTDGTRIIPIGEFFGTFKNSLKADEIITGIQIPKLQDGANQVFIKHRVRESIDFALISVASVLTLKDGICRNAGIALGAVAPVPFRAVGAEQALKGKPLNSETINAAMQASVEGAVPLRQNKYKVEILKTLVKRALEKQ
jgi:xanthine dehydrogenase YagS FAD-binding subunit